MKVTNTIRKIGKCRDLIASNDFKLILSYIGIFENVISDVQRHCEKFIKNDNYELDFTAYDLQELSDEIYNYIKDKQDNFKFKNMFNIVMQNQKIDDKVFNDITTELANKMHVDDKLRKVYKTLSYFALSILLWQEARKNEN